MIILYLDQRLLEGQAKGCRLLRLTTAPARYQRRIKLNKLMSLMTSQCLMSDKSRLLHSHFTRNHFQPVHIPNFMVKKLLPFVTKTLASQCGLRVLLDAARRSYPSQATSFIILLKLKSVLTTNQVDPNFKNLKSEFPWTHTHFVKSCETQ